MGAKIFGVLFVIFVLGIAYYVSDSGTLGKLVSRTFFESATSTPAGETTSTTITPPASPPQPTPPPQAVPPLETRDERLDIPVGEIPSGFARDELSRNFRKVRIGGVLRQNPADPRSYGEISLSANFSRETGPIAVTGWYIRGNRGDVMTIPRGIEVYSPYGSGVERDIALASREVIRIFSSTSPLGKNIKLNKCVGYLENSLDFTPTLPRSCPRDVDRAEIADLKGKCQDYILSLGTCAEPDINHRDVIDDRECQAYLAERYGYRGCFDRYLGDADFLSGEWHVWAKELFPDLDERHDRVLLFDREGLLVDLRTY